MNEERVKRWIIKANSDLKISKDEMITSGPCTEWNMFSFSAMRGKIFKSISCF
jgi:hypothetical protein